MSLGMSEYFGVPDHSRFEIFDSGTDEHHEQLKALFENTGDEESDEDYDDDELEDEDYDEDEDDYDAEDEN